MTKMKKAARPNKLNAWLRAYTDQTNPETFLNKTASARAAGYRCTTNESFRSVGYQNFTKLHYRVEKWFDDIGMSDNSLKIKLLKLLEAKETKFFQYQGEVTDQREVEASEIQLKTLDMILKIKGMYAPNKRELTGKGEKPIQMQIITSIPNPKMPSDEPDSDSDSDPAS